MLIDSADQGFASFEFQFGRKTFMAVDYEFISSHSPSSA